MNSCQSIYFLDDPQNRNILENILVNGIINDNKDVLEQYLKDGGSPDRRIKDKDTLLETAIDAHKIWAVELLVKYKANINLFRYDGYTPLARAVISKNIRALNILLEAGADPNAGNIEYEITPLFVAANEGNNQAIKPLLSYGARTHLGVDRESIWTQVLTEKMFHTLLREGVDPLLNDQWGRNALHYAAA